MDDRAWRRPALGCLVAALALIAALVAACDQGGADGSRSRLVAPEPSGDPGIGQAQAPAGCTGRAADPDGMRRVVASASPGDRICLTGDMGSARLTVKRSGTADRPITVLGGGEATTAGITVEANHVVIDGIIAREPRAPGISLKGNNLTVSNSASLSPRQGDGDGIRFWGTDIKILHNTITNTRGTDESHADCMQTFATDEGHLASQNVLIDGNRCEKIDNICMIAEGPNSEAGDGSGKGRSTNFVFSNNHCDNGAGQAVFIDDVSNVQVINNDIVGRVNKAFAFQNRSTGVTVQRNRIAPGIRYEVAIDDSSRPGYQGPEPGGTP